MRFDSAAGYCLTGVLQLHYARLGLKLILFLCGDHNAVTSQLPEARLGLAASFEAAFLLRVFSNFLSHQKLMPFPLDMISLISYNLYRETNEVSKIKRKRERQ